MLLQSRGRNSCERFRQTVALCISLVLGLSLLLLSLPRIVSASGPENGPGQKDGRVIGLASDALECLAVGNDLPTKASGVVKLTWQGQAERARLVLNVAGSEAPHTIKVNGHPVVQVPIHPGGQPCGYGASFYLDISPDILMQGENLIEITNDALTSDDWTAAYVRLEVLGDIAVAPTAGPAATPSPIGPADAGAPVSSLGFDEVFVFDLTFNSSYDGSEQHFLAQIPVDDINDCKSIPLAPLVIYVHGRSSNMYEPFNEEGWPSAAQSKGWLLASPELHGSWPESTGGWNALASLESQYDIFDTVNYMVQHCNVKPDQIYMYGSSMGGQIATVVAAKFPHLFAALFDNKGITDLEQWYWEMGEFTRGQIEQECHIDGVPQGPLENPFCYERRSSVNFASNYIHIPISITHSVSDQLVPITHSRNLRDAINSYDPDQLASIFEENGGDDGGSACSYHCYEPDPMAVLNFLESFTLNNNPIHINITTDESKSYYWLNIIQTGGDHWSQVEATYHPLTTTVTATISDTEPLTVAFNLGSTPITEVITRPGMGLPATTYLVSGGGNYKLEDYTSGYLTATLNNTGQFSLTISAIAAEVSANPATILANQTATSTLTVVVKDQLNNPVPDGTSVVFSTTLGTFPSGISTDTVQTAGGTATIVLTAGSTGGQAEIVASVGSITASTSVSMMVTSIYFPIITKETTLTLSS